LHAFSPVEICFLVLAALMTSKNQLRIQEYPWAANAGHKRQDIVYGCMPQHPSNWSLSQSILGICSLCYSVNLL